MNMLAILARKKENSTETSIFDHSSGKRPSPSHVHSPNFVPSLECLYTKENILLEAIPSSHKSDRHESGKLLKVCILEDLFL